MPYKFDIDGGAVWHWAERIH